MASIKENLEHVTAQLPKGVQLVAVSKFHPVEELREAYDAGQRLFGENRVQELVAKAPQLPENIRWHFIGHLQKNKVRMLMPHVSVIESVDSVKLLQLIEKEASRIDRTVEVLLQLHVAQEETKSGFSIDEVLEAAEAGELTENLPHVRVCGVMAMASLTDDMEQVAREFDLVRRTYCTLKDGCFDESPYFNHLSMGMSDDWPVAVKYGATLVRIGTAVFGPRKY
ncbi:MAG: YggS family pyridoxal phosphate-dependent enzyme [Muribaculaceae bacterium]|nr:YggS family pyridoxal phosphate-dependent enzyme [Muribaculaceae bacterium]